MNPVLSFAAPLAALALVGASFFAIPLPPDKTAAEYGELAIIYFKLHDPRAEAAFERALAMDPGNVRNHYGAGVAAFEAARYDVAERELEIVLKAEPTHIDAIYALAAVFEKTGRAERIEGLLKQMVAIDPQDSRPYQDLAQIEIGRRNWRAAKDHLTTYLRLVPTKARKARKRAEAKLVKLNEKLGEAPPSPAPFASPATSPTLIKKTP